MLFSPLRGNFLTFGKTISSNLLQKCHCTAIKNLTICVQLQFPSDIFAACDLTDFPNGSKYAHICMELGDPGGKSSYYLPYDVSAETPQHYSDSGAAGNVLNMMLVTLNIERKLFSSHEYGM